MFGNLFLALTVSIRWRLLFPTLCWSINTKSMFQAYFLQVALDFISINFNILLTGRIQYRPYIPCCRKTSHSIRVVSESRGQIRNCRCGRSFRSRRRRNTGIQQRTCGRYSKGYKQCTISVN
jgi:hypothetical protein